MEETKRSNISLWTPDLVSSAPVAFLECGRYSQRHKLVL